MKIKRNRLLAKANGFLRNEKGEGHLLAVVVVAVVVLGLAVLFGDELTSIVKGLIDSMKIGAGKVPVVHP